MRELLVSGVGQARFPGALVIEANPAHGRLVGELMNSIGFEHVWVGMDSAKAFADLHELNPDLLVLAVEAVPLDGFTLARTVRAAAQAPLNELPIIFLTPNATEQQVSKVREVGRSALLVRPPTRENLRSHVALLQRTVRSV